MNQKEIAQLAGVSVSTVSRVINDDPRISERTKQTVREILAANPYVTNNNARNLRVSRTNAIGFLISSFNNPYFISIYEGLRFHAGRPLAGGGATRESCEYNGRW